MQSDDAGSRDAMSGIWRVGHWCRGSGRACAAS